MKPSAKRLAFVAVFGAVISVTKVFVPSPMNKMFVIIQALLLAVGALILGKMGATYVALIGGVLTAMWNLALAPFTLLFALLYGLLVDGFFFLFKIDVVEGRVATSRLIAAMTLSTMLVGVSSFYVMTHLMYLKEYLPLLVEIILLIMGTISGSFAGYLAALVWNRYLRNAKL